MISMSNTYDGYMQTYSGEKFYPENPSWSSIMLVDIVHALSNICRYSGHTKEFYSVAEHCLVMAELFPEYTGLALFHDAAEAFLADLPRPVKKGLPEYKLKELKLLNIIFDMAGLAFTQENFKIIEHMDIVLLAHEKRSPKIMQNRDISWGEEIDSITDPVYEFKCYSQKEVKPLYDKAVREFLTKKR